MMISPNATASGKTAKRFSTILLLTLLSNCLAQVANVCETTHPYDYDSRMTSATVTTTVSYARTPWLQLNLSKSKLSEGAKLVLTGTDTSLELDSQTLASLNGFSPVINGDSVTVDLVSPAKMRGSKKSRVVISEVKTGTCDGDDFTAASICGDTDDRIPSTDVRVGRIGGCTGWLISEDVFIQAGHCGTPSSSTRIHFAYGVGNAPVEDQYAVDVSSYQGVNGGVGNDWGAGRLLPNSVTGKLPGVAQSEKCDTAGCGWFTLGSVPSSVSGNNIRITGYGTAAVDSRSQKTHVGALASLSSTSLRYVPDTTGGNSGSPVIHEETGHAIGVHTHGGCTATSGSNAGTRIDVAAFNSHVDFLLGGSTSSPTPAPAPCVASDFKLTILTDNYPSETTWALVNQCTGQTQAQGGPYQSAGTQYVEEECVPMGEYTFTINDSYGDGICCGYGSGSYTLEYNGDVIKEGGAFTSSESTTFGSCDAPSTAAPTSAPTAAPTAAPTNASTTAPTAAPTSAPTDGTAPPVTAPTGGGDWELVYEDDFETDQGVFMGTNKRFDLFSYPDGNWSLRIRKTSQLKSTWIDIPDYSQVSFKFWMHATGMEVGDNFFFQVRFNGETAFTSIDEWVSGTDFTNREWLQQTMTIDVPAGKSKIQLLFKGDSDKRNDRVYIDQVRLEGNPN